MRIFVISASESSAVATAVKSNLDENSLLAAQTTPWMYGSFGAGEYTLDSLLSVLKTADFAIVVSEGIDSTTERNVAFNSARDNVVFEAGLFMGRLGRRRVLLLDSADQPSKIPSDLFGLTRLTSYSLNRDQTPKAAVATACAEIARIVRQWGPVTARPPSERVAKPLEPASTEIPNLTDSALYVSDDDDYRRFEDQQQMVLRQGKIPTKLLYHSPEGADRWLEICRDGGSYPYYDESVTNTRNAARLVAATIRKESHSEALDFVSLGPGDGVKDKYLVGELVRQLGTGERISYYPIDVSETLIVKSIRAMSGFKSRLDIKAILGDFTRLPSLKPVYELRKGLNVFSILGNTLGNTSEREILDALRMSLEDRDFVLLGIKNGTELEDGVDKFLRLGNQVAHGFAPLKSLLGLEYEEKRMRVDEVPETNGDGKRTFRTWYDCEGLGQVERDSITLAEMHYYDVPALVERLTAELGVTLLIDPISYKSSSIVLMQYLDR